MHYKTACPKCGKKISRWYLSCEPTFYHRCRGCGARCRMGISGYIVAGVALLFAFLWFGMFLKHILSKSAAVTLEMLTLVLTIWLLPYFTTTRLKREAEIKSEETTD